MKKLILISAISIIVSTSVKGQSKPDTLKESEVITISQLLAFGEQAAGNSDKVTTSQYNAYHAQVAKIDSVLGVMYRKWHPVKTTPKIEVKPKKDGKN
jgi:hypothetical protein